MNIVNLNGGLGNQLFQLSFGMAMQYEFDIDVKFCNKFINRKQLKIEDIFDTQIPIAQKNDYQKTVGKLFFSDSFRHYYLRLLKKVGLSKFQNFILENYSYPYNSLPNYNNMFFYGYWQNYNFFYKNLGFIKKKLKIKNLEFYNNLLDKFYDTYSDIVCLHIRLGDYKNTKNLKVYSEIPMEYYLNSINLFEKKLLKPLFILFSDQIEKIEKNFLKKNVIPSTRLPNHTNNDDFKIMALCDSYILTNSTFSLWAAYLSNSKNKFFTKPNSWFKDKTMEAANQYYPNDWNYLV